MEIIHTFEDTGYTLEYDAFGLYLRGRRQSWNTYEITPWSFDDPRIPPPAQSKLNKVIEAHEQWKAELKEELELERRQEEEERLCEQHYGGF